jgi:subtilisin family serine protease
MTTSHLICTLAVAALLYPTPPRAVGTPAPQADQGSGMPLFITVRIRPDVQPETLKYLASVAEEEKVVVQPSSCSVAPFPLDSVPIAAPSPQTAGCDLKGVVRDYYGLSLPKLRALVSKVVPGLGDLLTADQPLSVSLPASLKGTVGLKVKPERSLTLRQLALSLLGQDGPRTRKNVERANPSLAGKWDHLVTHSVTIPFVAQVVSYRLRPPFAEQPETVVRKLKEDPAVLSAEVTRGYRIVPSYGVSSIPASTPPGLPAASPNWPLETLPADWTEFDKAVRRVVKVAVADTGLDSNDSRFNLWTNFDPMGTPADYEAQQCAKYVHGCNFLNPAHEPDDDSADHHGTHVAGLASARLYTHLEEINNRIELMILKVADRDGQVKPEILERAVTYGCDQLAQIMNLSLSGDYYTPLTDVMEGQCRTVLYVAAAGNSASLDSTQACNAGQKIWMDFDDKAHPADRSTGYPARLASSYDNVISVGAADTQGRICDFSNRGNQSVSLVAPGYGVTSTAPGGTAVLNGSSQATALVTLAAALLYSQGYSSPATVKYRIIASTDFVPDLRDKVFSSGKLNIAKALNFKQDAIHYNSGLVEYGTIVSPQYVYSSSQANGLYLGCAVYRIVPNYSADPKQVELTVLNAEKRLEHQYTDHLDPLSFRTAQGLVKTVSPDDLLDIVPHPRVCQ